MRWILVYIGTCAGLLAVATAAVLLVGDGFDETGGLPMSIHGFIALGLGVGLTSAVAVGLMALIFHSARSGHDDDASTLPHKDPE